MDPFFQPTATGFLYSEPKTHCGRNQLRSPLITCCLYIALDLLLSGVCTIKKQKTTIYVYIYIYICGTPPACADLSHVHAAIGGSAPVRSADRANFHMGKTWPRGTFDCYKKTKKLTSHVFEWAFGSVFLLCLTMCLGPNLVCNLGHQIRRAQAFKFSKSLSCQRWPRHYFNILLAPSCFSLLDS